MILLFMTPWWLSTLRRNVTLPSSGLRLICVAFFMLSYLPSPSLHSSSLTITGFLRPVFTYWTLLKFVIYCGLCTSYSFRGFSSAVFLFSPFPLAILMIYMYIYAFYPHFDSLQSENEGDTFLRNVGKHWHDVITRKTTVENFTAEKTSNVKI